MGDLQFLDLLGVILEVVDMLHQLRAPARHLVPFSGRDFRKQERNLDADKVVCTPLCVFLVIGMPAPTVAVKWIRRKAFTQKPTYEMKTFTSGGPLPSQYES